MRFAWMSPRMTCVLRKLAMASMELRYAERFSKTRLTAGPDHRLHRLMEFGAITSVGG